VKYSDYPGVDKPGPRKRWAWTKVLKALKVLRKATDDSDSERAKREYHGRDEEFNTLFSYRKGSKLVPLKKSAQIARIFRKLEGHPRFWDYEEDEKGEESEEEPIS